MWYLLPVWAVVCFLNVFASHSLIPKIMLIGCGIGLVMLNDNTWVHWVGAMSAFWGVFGGLKLALEASRA